MAEKTIIIPLSERSLLTIKEAAALYGIGQNKLSKMLHVPGCSFALRNGNRMMLKRDAFDRYLQITERI